MRKTLLSTIVAALFGSRTVRAKTRDVAYTYRMGAGFPGDVNRMHPASIEPCLIDAAAPPTAYGQPVLVDPTTQGVRPMTVGDDGLSEIYGITVRSFPGQQASASNYGAVAFGSNAPPATGVIDVLKSGYIMVQLNTGTPVKGGAVFVWVAASAGAHVQGGFEVAATPGSTAALDPAIYSFNGPPDSSGVTEVIIRP